MEAVGTSSRRAQTYALLSFAALVLAGCDVVTGCCRESFTVSHGLIYGVVRFSDGRGAVGASVHSTVVGTDTVTTKSGGAYRLPLAFPLLGPAPSKPVSMCFHPTTDPALIASREWHLRCSDSRTSRPQTARASTLPLLRYHRQFERAYLAHRRDHLTCVATDGRSKHGGCAPIAIFSSSAAMRILGRPPAAELGR